MVIDLYMTFGHTLFMETRHPTPTPTPRSAQKLRHLHRFITEMIAEKDGFPMSPEMAIEKQRAKVVLAKNKYAESLMNVQDEEAILAQMEANYDAERRLTVINLKATA